MVPSPRLTKHCCSGKEIANQSGEKRQEGPREPSFVRSPNPPPPQPSSPGALALWPMWRLFSALCRRYGQEETNNKKLMLKSRKKPQKGQGQESRQQQRRRPGPHRRAGSRRRGDSPGGRGCGEAALLPRPPRRGTAWGAPTAPTVWASTFPSFLRSPGPRAS